MSGSALGVEEQELGPVRMQWCELEVVNMSDLGHCVYFGRTKTFPNSSFMELQPCRLETAPFVHSHVLEFLVKNSGEHLHKLVLYCLRRHRQHGA